MVYALIVPLVLLDIFITTYQAVSYSRVRHPEKVARKDYLIFDRRYLAYLNLVEKFNCACCSYANGLIGYIREIASRTEPYWCPIKHARKVIGAHPRYSNFADFGDAQAYKDEVAALTEKVRRDRSA